MKNVRVCVAGATGAVGRTFLKVLEERQFPIETLYLLASEKSAGSTLPFKGTEIEVLDMATFDFSKADVALFSCGGAVSEIYAPKAWKSGCVVVDNSSHFRMHPNIPLVVPEVNPEAVADYVNHGIIANPNCSTIQMLVALKPIYDAVGISRIDVSTYQAVSGSGNKAIEELSNQIKQWQANETLAYSVYPKAIAFNAIPQVDVFTDNGYTKEEMKMVNETRKIFSDDSIEVNPTTVRIPVYSGHSESIYVKTRDEISLEKALGLLHEMESVVVFDDPNDYPTVYDCIDNDMVYVGRVRKDLSDPLGLNMWVVSDNLRKGAATNTVQIAEVFAKNYL